MYFIEQGVKRTTRENRNYLVFCGGSPGTGKSLAMVEWMEQHYTLLNKIISIKALLERIVFTVKAFMEIINRKNPDGTWYLQPGDILLFDEIGVEGNNRAWQTLTNKVLNFIIQTIRHRRIVILFTAPGFDYVDKSVRKLFHAYIETIKIFHSRGVNQCKGMDIQFNPRFGTVYMKYPKIVVNGKQGKLELVYFKMPSVKLRNAYEKKQSEFKNKLAMRLMDEIDDTAQEEEGEASIPEMIEAVVKDYNYYLRTRGNRKFIDPHLICGKFGVGNRRAGIVKSMVEKRLGL